MEAKIVFENVAREDAGYLMKEVGAKKAEIKIDQGRVIHHITITNRTKSGNRIGFLLTFVAPLSMIGLGVFLGSDAMQWFGFIASFLAIAAFANVLVAKENNLTIEQARARLDEIEQLNQ